MPLAAAVLAAPMRKEWPEKRDGLIPALDNVALSHWTKDSLDSDLSSHIKSGPLV